MVWRIYQRSMTRSFPRTVTHPWCDSRVGVVLVEKGLKMSIMASWASGLSKMRWRYLNSVCRGQILHCGINLQGSYEVKSVQVVDVLTYLPGGSILLQLDRIICPWWQELAFRDLRMSLKNAPRWMKKKSKSTPKRLSEGVFFKESNLWKETIHRLKSRSHFTI